jgi:hypothetical protein
MAGKVLLFTAVPYFALMLQGIGITVGILPAGRF